MASQIMVGNETKSCSSRMTKDGRKITYSMNVIQQPERARACGSGAKSSADRRPVDPPPIVELRIFEGDQMQNEITFSYNANFFLFATLENARNIAQGRVPTSNAFPVLTGTPVAGMAYLDRPAPAGYFIFPDLSVRHEGKYRLSFALYEELKEQKDMDSDDAPQPQEIRLREIDAHVSHRLEVKSAPFTVFSAKKFPGLTESTALSRMVAEQGCRVRIRRDVRMRRRDNKSSKDWDDYEEEAAYERARRTATPDGYGQSQMPTPQQLADGSDRPRSVSNASIASFGPPGRRPSMQEMAQAYQQGYQQPSMPPPQTTQSGYSAQIPYGTPQNHQYQQQYTPTQQQQQPMMQPPQPPYQPQQHAYQPQPQPQQQMPMGYVQSQQQYPQHDPRTQDGMEYPSAPTAYRRASGQMLHPPQQPEYSNQLQAPMPAWSDHRNAYYPNQPMQNMPPAQMPQHPTMPPASSSTTLPSSQPLAPLKTLQPVMDTKPDVTSPYTPNPMSSMADYAPGQAYFNSKSAVSSAPMSAMSTPSAWAEPAGATYFPPPKFPTQASQSTTQKRSFSTTFDTSHIETPLRQGARPNVVHSPDGYTTRHFSDTMDEDADDGFIESAAMSYRRADGTERRRVPLAS